MRIATWNINSVRLRIHHVLRFIKEQNIDVMCLQETKTEDKFFPIKEFINIDVSKQFQNSDFGGELSASQLKYCANDVIYLHKIHDELNKILERENRIELYQDCLKFLKTRVELDLALFKDDIWSH